MPLRRGLAPIAAAALLLLPLPAFAAGGGEVSPFVYQLMVFVIAIFVGYYVVWSVTPALHTPLMSGSNVVHGVVLVGAMVALGNADPNDPLQLAIGFFAVFLGAANAAGGYVVTERMLAMFKLDKKEAK